MPIICFQGIQSGVGTSTILANVARDLQILNQDVVIFDLNPNNLLRLHFNMEWRNPSGWARAELKKQIWHEAGYICEKGVNFIPYGSVTYDEQQIIERTLIHKGWLSSKLDLLNTSDKKWILLNVESRLSNVNIQAMSYADKIIRVLEPNTTCLAQLYESIQSNYFNDHDELNNKSFYLINKIMPLSELDSELSLVLKSCISNKLIPVKLHFDENTKECLAQKNTIQYYAPNSAAAKEIRTLTSWLILQYDKLVSHERV